MAKNQKFSIPKTGLAAALVVLMTPYLVLTAVIGAAFSLGASAVLPFVVLGVVGTVVGTAWSVKMIGMYVDDAMVIADHDDANQGPLIDISKTEDQQRKVFG